MILNKTIVAIIPARGGSKGVPRKNLRQFKGKSLLARTIESALSSYYIDKVVVSSEDEEILEEAKNAGADVPFVRPAYLAQDDTPGIDPILHAINELPHYTYAVLLQVTSPLRTTKDIDNCIQLCIQKNAPACVSVCEVDKHPYWMFTKNEDLQLTPLFSDADLDKRRQDLPLVYALNGAIYMADTNWLKQNKSFVTNETISFLMSKENSIDIDAELDFVLLEAYETYRNINNNFVLKSITKK